MDQPKHELAAVASGPTGLQLRNFDDMWRFAKCIANSGWAPRGMDKPESILAALQLGAEIGMTPMAALQSVAVINGRPSVYGDAALALVRASGLLESYTVQEVGTTGTDTWGFKVTAKRVGYDPISETFLVSDAKAAGLWGKSGPWKDYPKRMLMFRARGFVLRDGFGDVLKGLKTTEEVMDYKDVIDVSPVPMAAVMAAMPNVAAPVPAPVQPAPEDVASQFLASAVAVPESAPVPVEVTTVPVVAEEPQQRMTKGRLITMLDGFLTDANRTHADLIKWAKAKKIVEESVEGIHEFETAMLKKIADNWTVKVLPAL